MQLSTGLNPYGLTYHLGLEARGTPRANPAPAGLDGFLALGDELGCRVLEIWDGWLDALDEAGLAGLAAHLGARGMVPVVSSGLQRNTMANCARLAHALGAGMVRFNLTPVLCGDRSAAGPAWAELIADVRDRLAAAAEIARAEGLTVLIENHQDFTSAELAGFCEQFGPAVRIVYDTGNSFPVGEAPLDFTETVAPYVRHVHLKDYRAQWTDEGIRLVRCAIGDGAVPLTGLMGILARHHDEMTAVLEPGALEARHVRFFTPQWWQGYPPQPASAFAACLAAARVNRLPDDADWRTPWERNEDGGVAAYELAMIRRSAANMRQLGLM